MYQCDRCVLHIDVFVSVCVRGGSTTTLTMFYNKLSYNFV